MYKHIEESFWGLQITFKMLSSNREGCRIFVLKSIKRQLHKTKLSRQKVCILAKALNNTLMDDLTLVKLKAKHLSKENFFMACFKQ